MTKPRAFVFFLILLAAFAGSVFYFKMWSSDNQVGGQQKEIASSFSNNASSTLDASASTAAPAPSSTQMRLYTEQKYKFSVEVPASLADGLVDEGAGAETVTFEQPSADPPIGFQIFIVPYAAAQITQAQIAKDTHGSAIGTPQEAVIGPSTSLGASGGIHALIFWSQDPILGKMREVWFIYPELGRGVPSSLYEVTTYAELDSWLAGIMHTWRFI